MSEARLTSRGRVAIPKDVRTRLNLKPGDRIRFLLDDDGTVRLRAINKDVSSLFGILPRPKRRATLAEIDEGIRAAAAKRFRRP